MKHLFVVLLLLSSSLSHAAIFGGLDPQNVPSTNKLPNGGFENGTASWTSSGSATFTTVTSAPNLAVGARTAAWEPNAASDALTSKQIDVDPGHFGQTCVASLVYKGAGPFISAQVIDGTSAVLGTVDLPSVTDFTTKEFVFTGPASGTIAFRIFSTADSINAYVDDVFVGCNAKPTLAVSPVVYERTDTVTGFGGATGTIAHGLSIPVESQDWSAVVTTGSASLQLDPSVFITDKTANDIDYDFSGLTGTDTVTIRLSSTGVSANVLSSATYDSGVVSASPSFPVNHGLPSRPKHVVVWTEGQSIAGKWDSRYDLCSADDDDIDCDLSALTIDGSHRVQVIASMTPAGTSVACADATRNGLLCVSDQDITGTKTFSEAPFVSRSGEAFIWDRGNAGVAGAIGYDGTNIDMYVGTTTGHTFQIRINDVPTALFTTTGDFAVGTLADVNSPQGRGHFSNGDSGAASPSSANELFVENSGDAGITIATPNTDKGSLAFSDPQDSDAGLIRYDHDAQRMEFIAESLEFIEVDALNVQVNVRHDGTSAGAADACFSSASAGLRKLGPCTASSREIKDSIRDLDDMQVEGLRPVRFDYKDKGLPQNQIGLIAEEVAVTHPELAKYREDGSPYDVNYEHAVGLLVLEIQRLKTRLNELESSQ